nr:phosphoglucan phosphatase (LSF) [Polytomella parva]|eukprot:CAMPEP_0175055852 /NCGR_PEP_ID=MMETSP0052_2-20121109/10321_1 /TAXON_ID=51329 ORGANISM="Polytomella parva, Strain SAG 63-3" /NCGR_SAMPLE_ID=MMETSP0052_2 /ASSEMBLY_ACC=CAM_ASM_000194 /LENGTH=316 /DNA_ID=CAMNT_0016320765 /DNA_START=253 /DNA_END=1203 /DNA_ORIENTATION=-
MQKKMGTALTYRHEDGLNFTRIYPDLIVGSCLQTPADVDRLATVEKVSTIISLQEDCDMAFFNLDGEAIRRRCQERGDINHVRFPIRDFDPYDLRLKLPRAVSKIAKEFQPGENRTLYIHCTAGLGRAPAVALSFLTWIRKIPLEEAFNHLRSLRPCSPRIEAVRAATADLLLGVDPIAATIGFDGRIDASRIQIAGLDVGWHQRLDLKPTLEVPSRFEVKRNLLPGRYLYKLVIDGGHWTISPDHPTLRDGNNLNNYLEVRGGATTEEAEEAQKRLLAPGGEPTEEERERVLDLLCPWDTREANAVAAVEGKKSG